MTAPRAPLPSHLPAQPLLASRRSLIPHVVTRDTNVQSNKGDHRVQHAHKPADLLAERLDPLRSRAGHFLYPFTGGGEDDLEALISDLARSVQDKAAGSASLCTATLERLRPSLATAADAMARRFAGGGRLYTFGNGGSSTDAAALAALFSTPPRARPLPARNLAEDSAVITALGTDIGFSNIFLRALLPSTQQRQPVTCIHPFDP